MAKTLFDAINELGLSHLSTQKLVVKQSECLGSILNSGIYFLILNDNIVYVGQSVCAAARIVEHAREGKKEFDRFFIYRCPEEDLNLLETLFILYYQPFYNGLPSHLVANSEYSLISKQGIKRYLVDTPFTLNHFNKWERNGFINPVVKYKNITYYWLSDWKNLFSNKVKEYGVEKYHSYVKTVERCEEKRRNKNIYQF